MINRIKKEVPWDDGIRNKYVDTIASKFRDLPEQTEYVKTEWKLFCLTVSSLVMQYYEQNWFSIVSGGKKKS